jgi:hypothetical protein
VLVAAFSFAWSAEAQNKSIKLRNETIVTSPRALRATTAAQPNQARVSGLYLVQLEGRVQPEWRKRLQDLGVELVRYVPEDSFIVRLENVRPAEVEAIEFVRWVGQYRPDHKLHKLVRERATNRGPGEHLPISALLIANPRPNEMADARRNFQSIESQSTSQFGTVLRGRIPPGQLQKLAESPAVLWVEPAPNIKLFDEVASKIVAGDAGPGRLLTHELGYDGSGVTIAVADSGLDTGEAATMHPDLFGRVTGFFFYGDLTDASDEHSHGTHVAGIVAGNGAASERDEEGALFGLGVAPGASIVAQRLFDAEGGYHEPVDGFEMLTRDATGAGAEIGSNSWGDDTQGRYDISAMEFDALVRDADGLTFGDQPYILEFSAGNAGPGPQTIGSPAVAKNVIATGASVNNRFNLPIEEFTIYDTGQETMADFSSRGPCEDGRIKPDVVAPGTWIASLRSEYANDDFAWWPISDEYMYQGGTSQAGPHVSGAAAVFVQYWREAHTNQTPSPALVKAALIHSAVDMDDSVETEPVPNMDEGWGRVDLTQIIATSRAHEFIDQTSLLISGQTYEQRVLVDNPDEPLKITLVYTDLPGFPGAVPALVNDLDLEVVGPDGTVYRGNQFASGESVPNAPLPDAVNNVEGVLLSTPLLGEYIVRIRARNVVPRPDTGAAEQDFALVISGSFVRPGIGIVALDRRAYTAPSQIRMTLFDANLAGQTTASVTLRSTTEPSGEPITLRATGSSGVFTASVATATGPALLNSRLEISHGDTIEATYQDAAPPSTRRFTARADLLPPVISNVNAEFDFGRVIVSWRTDEEASGIVRYGTNSQNLAVTNGFLDLSQETVLTGIKPNVVYRYFVVAEDAAGNRATNNNGGALFTFTATETPSLLIVDDYNNDFFPVPSLAGYTAPIAQLGLTYDVWDTESRGPIPPGALTPYRCVIWRAPEFRLGGTWTATSAQAVTNYLAGGGSLLIASMEFLSRLEEDSFPNFARDWLQVQSFVADTGVPHISGAVGEPIGSGIDVDLDYIEYEDEFKELLGFTADASDIITATTNASPIFLDGSFVAGVRSPRPGRDLPGRVVFLSFPIDAVPIGSGIGNNRAGLLRNIFGFLMPQEGSSTITLDSDVYGIPGVVTIEVEDLDLAGQGQTTARAFSPLQTSGVPLILTETSRRGLFRGSVALVPANPAPSGAELPVQSGDTFRIEYLDASAGRVVTITAQVETTPPVISNVEFAADYVEALVVWDTSELTDALVQYSESPGEFPINLTAYDGNFDTSHLLVMDRLKPAQTYYFRIVSRDRAGNSTMRDKDDNGQPYSFTTLTPIESPWTDHLESGSADWTVVPVEGTELEWELGVPHNGATATSPVNAWGTSLNNSVAGLAESVLVSPAIYLIGGDRITLRFMQNYDFIPSDNSDGFEFGLIELYTNLNTAAVPLGQVSDSSFGEWEELTMDLTPYRGQLVYIAWHYVMFSIENEPRFGWLLDDISITTSNIVPGVVRITNNLWQARYVMSGPRGRSGQGASFIMTNAPPGEYRITFGQVPFYGTPAPQTNTLDPLGTVTFHGEYLLTDANGNGMSDQWEQQHFGAVSPTRSRVTDTDGDGFPDYAEFVAGTDPAQPNSILRLNSPVAQPDGTARLAWASIPGRAYLVERSSNGTSWTAESGWILATGNLTTFAPVPAANPAHLFRLQVRP